MTKATPIGSESVEATRSVETTRTARSFTSLAVRRVLGSGLISPDEVHRYGVQGRDLSRSNGVVLVEAGNGRSFVVKTADPSREAGQGSAAVELAVYRAAREHPRLARLVPPVRDYDESSGLLILDGLHTSRGMERLSGAISAYGSEVAEWFGRALGEWHRSAAELEGFPPADPWLLRRGEDDRLPVLDQVPELRRLADRVAADPELAEAIGRARRVWCDTTLIHGDVRFANTLVQTSPPAVRLVDWEMAGRGDPLWDVAGAVQEYVSLFGTVEPLDDPRSGPVIRSFLDAWATAVGSPLDLRRLAPFVACRLVLRAFQLVNRSEGWEAVVEERLESARCFGASAREPRD